MFKKSHRTMITISGCLTVGLHFAESLIPSVEAFGRMMKVKPPVCAVPKAVTGSKISGDLPIGARVEIRMLKQGHLRNYDGKTGTVVDISGVPRKRKYAVKLDEAVKTSWGVKGFATIRHRHLKPIPASVCFLTTLELLPR